MGVNDFFFGSPGSQQTYYPPPVYPPGWGFANAFWDQIMPGLLNQGSPQYQGSLDPGMSPTAAAALRMGQNQAMSPLPELFGNLYGSLGQYMRPPSTFQPDRGPGQSVLQSFMGIGNPAASASNWSGPSPDFGFGSGPPSYSSPWGPSMAPNRATPSMPQSQGLTSASPGVGAMDFSRSPSMSYKGGPGGDPGMLATMNAFRGQPPGNPQAGGPQRVYDRTASPFPIGNPTEDDPRSGTQVTPADDPSRNTPSNLPTPNPNDDGKPDRPGGGGGGSVPTGGSSTPPPTTPGANPSVMGGPPGLQIPGWSSIPTWMQNFLIGSGLNLIAGGGDSGGGGGGIPGGVGTPPATPKLEGYKGPSGKPAVTPNPSFVDWNPGSDTINMVPGLSAGRSTTLPGVGGVPGAPGGPTPNRPGSPGGGGPAPTGPVPQGQLEWFGQWRGPNRGKSMEEIRRDMYERGWDYGPNFKPPEGWGAQGSKATTWDEVYAKNPNRRGGAPPGAPGASGARPATPPGDLSGDMIPGRPGGVTGRPTGPPVPASAMGSVVDAFGGNRATPQPAGPQLNRKGLQSAAPPPSSPMTFGGGTIGHGGSGMASLLEAFGGGQKPLKPTQTMQHRPTGAPAAGQAPMGFPGGGQAPSVSGGPLMAPPGGGGGMPDFSSAGLNAARDAYLSAVPVMKQDMTDAIGDAMSTAGFTGNRFSSSAMNSAAQEGSKAGLRQNQLMGSLLRDATESSLNRGLQATGMSLDDQYRYNQMGWQGNENAMDRGLGATRMMGDLMGQQQGAQRQAIQDLFGMGQWEQGRQDQFNLLPFFDWSQNRYGMLPDIMRMVGGVGNPSLQSPTTTSSPGGAGAIDWMNLVNAFRGMYGGG